MQFAHKIPRSYASTGFRAAANRCAAGDLLHAPRGGARCNLAMDTATSDIGAVEFTPGSDSPVLPEFARSAPRGRRNRHRDRPLSRFAQTTAGQWMRCIKAFGERIAARDPDRQTAETQIRGTLMTRFNALGTADIIRVA